jgi:hypothetical protein
MPFVVKAALDRKQKPKCFSFNRRPCIGVRTSVFGTRYSSLPRTGAVGDEAVLDMILSFKQTYEARGAA